jgi:hypothetical protein
MRQIGRKSVAPIPESPKTAAKLMIAAFAMEERRCDAGMSLKML